MSHVWGDGIIRRGRANGKNMHALVADALEVVCELHDGVEGVCELDFLGVVGDEDGLCGFDGDDAFLALSCLVSTCPFHPMTCLCISWRGFA